MGLGAAVVGAAGIGAAGSLASGIIGSNASQQASQQQYSADQQALAQQKSMFTTAQNALSPYYQAGQSVLPTLTNLLTPGASQTSTLSQLPGIQFQSQYGDLAATNQLAAQGLGGSGGPLGTALSNYNSGLASTSYNNLVNQLQGYASMGSGAAGALAGDAISSGNSQASTIQSGGNALASGTLGSANATSSALSGLGGSANNALLMSSLLNKGTGIYGGFNYGDADTASAAQAGVQSGLSFNALNGDVY